MRVKPDKNRSQPDKGMHAGDKLWHLRHFNF